MFNEPLVRRDQYRFGSTIDQPDTMDGRHGDYRVWLNPTTRDHFHKILRTCLEEFLIVKDDQCRSNAFLDDLRKQADEPYYRNEDPFDCITCMETIDKGDGILLRHCLHPCCKPCLVRLIETSTEPTIPCPHDDCSTLIEERELRGVSVNSRTVSDVRVMCCRWCEILEQTRN